MNQFSNDLISIDNLPQFETVTFTKLERDYWKILCIHFVLVLLLLAVPGLVSLSQNEELHENKTTIILAFIGLAIVFLGLMRLSFVKKGFAFREHDLLFTYGIIATRTIIIPYNRIQHVSTHEGIFARYFGLSKIEIFTAGGSSSDIEIPGIVKEDAEKIKQLLTSRIQKNL